MGSPPAFIADDDDVLMETPASSPDSHLGWTDLDLQAAVAASMDELDNLGQGDRSEGIGQLPIDSQTYQGAASAMGTGAEGFQPRIAAEKALKEQLKRFQHTAQYALDKRIELPLLNSADADTLVIIDPPPVTRKCGEEACGCGLAPVENAPHRMHSDRLRATGSAYFADALSPTKQFRIARRRRLLPLPPGIKFVIDLTPPEEGDTAVELTTELSCSWGVRQYFHAEQRFGVRASLVSGHDDLEERNIIEEAQNPRHTVQEKGSSVPMDYTAVRHRLAIERVLHIIEGLDPRIDSAPKMWSVFSVAKFLNCTSEVENYIIGWIYAERNHRFIETLPEVSLKIAEGLQNQMLCRDAFSVLVGEEALASVGRDINGRLWRSRTRRRREELDLDSFITRVEYASKAFAERVNATFRELSEAKWITETAEYRNVVSFLKTRLKNNCDVIEPLTSRLRSFVRTRIFHALSRLNPPPVDLCGSVPPEGHNGKELFPYMSHTDVYADIHHKEALLIRHYWSQLKDEDLLAQDLVPYTYPNLPVSDIEDDFQKTTWHELLRETESFNWWVLEMVSINGTTLGDPSPMGDPNGIPGPRARPPCVPLPKIPDSEASAQEDTDSTHCLPIRTKIGQRGPTPDSQGNTIRRYLPIRPKPWVRGPAPLAPLDAELAMCAPTRPEGTGPRPSRFGGGTVDPRDVTLVRQRHDSGEASERADEVAEVSPKYMYRPRGSIPQEAAGKEAEANSNGIMECPGGSRFQFHPFNILGFLTECRDRIRAVAGRMEKGNVSFDPLITDTLLCLDENEWKYLPLYAGGNDDGSGGVFDQLIPNAVTGPIGPGPKYHIGQGSAASSEFDMIDSKSGVSSSFDTSMGVEDGYSDHLDRRNVYSDDGMGGGDVKGKGKARDVGREEAVEGEDDMMVVERDFDGDGSEDFCDVGHDSMLFA